MNSHTDPASRVSRGVEHLNDRAPGWLNAMPEDLSELNINDDDNCVCGHSYNRGYRSLALAGVHSEEQAEAQGFMTLSFLRHPLAWFGDNRRLTDAWRQKIAALRGNQRAGEGQGQ